MRNSPNTSASLLAAALILVFAVFHAAAQTEAKPDPLAPLARFVGSWSGTATGWSGDGTVARTYSPGMRGRHPQETNVSRYPAREAGKAEEVHEHMSMFSFDKARTLIVLRQFHIEGFVNTYRQVSAPGHTAAGVRE